MSEAETASVARFVIKLYGCKLGDITFLIPDVGSIFNSLGVLIYFSSFKTLSTILSIVSV